MGREAVFILVILLSSFKLIEAGGTFYFFVAVSEMNKLLEFFVALFPPASFLIHVYHDTRVITFFFF